MVMRLDTPTTKKKSTGYVQSFLKPVMGPQVPKIGPYTTAYAKQESLAGRPTLTSGQGTKTTRVSTYSGSGGSAAKAPAARTATSSGSGGTRSGGSGGSAYDAAAAARRSANNAARSSA